MVILGILVANILAMGIMAVSKLIADGDSGMTNVFVFTDFFILPFFMGIVCAWFWKDLTMGGGAYTLFAIVNSLVAIGASAVFLKEGVICLVIVSPLIMGLNIAGVFVGKALFRRKKNTLNVSVMALLLLIGAADLLSEHRYESMVSDTLQINAPVAEVWKYVVAYEPNTAKEDYWLFQVGMPSPLQSTVDCYCEGGNRKCIFSNGYVFDEKMTVYQPEKELTFIITNQPRDPEIMGHIDIQKGQFLLKDNGNGTTTLVGNSWYRLYVFPAWYFDTWAASITRNVHLRVMKHIKLLSEKNV
jgi:hypothetical protein